MHPGILAHRGRHRPSSPEWAAIALVLLTLTILLVTMRRISHSLKDWSLGSALSEEVTYKTSDGTTTLRGDQARAEREPLRRPLRARRDPGAVHRIRTDAAVGRRRGRRHQAKAEQFSHQYLMYGVVMFAPYAVNKFASLGEMFGSRR